MCEFTIEHILGAVALAVLSPADWHRLMYEYVERRCQARFEGKEP